MSKLEEMQKYSFSKTVVDSVFVAVLSAFIITCIAALLSFFQRPACNHYRILAWPDRPYYNKAPPVTGTYPDKI